MRPEPGEALPAEFLRVGLQFPDGATVTNLDVGAWRLSPDATEPGHGLDSQSGGGSGGRYKQHYWAWPLSGRGKLSFVVEWPAFTIGENRYDLDGEVLRVAAERAQPVWPHVTGPSHTTLHGRIQHFHQVRQVGQASPYHRAQFGQSATDGPAGA